MSCFQLVRVFMLSAQIFYITSSAVAIKSNVRGCIFSRLMSLHSGVHLLSIEMGTKGAIWRCALFQKGDCTNVFAKNPLIWPHPTICFPSPTPWPADCLCSLGQREILLLSMRVLLFVCFLKENLIYSRPWAANGLWSRQLSWQGGLQGDGRGNEKVNPWLWFQTGGGGRLRASAKLLKPRAKEPAALMDSVPLCACILSHTLCLQRQVLKEVIGGWEECNQKYLKARIVAFCQLTAVIVWHNWLWWWIVPPTDIFTAGSGGRVWQPPFVLSCSGFSQIQFKNG